MQEIGNASLMLAVFVGSVAGVLVGNVLVFLWGTWRARRWWAQRRSKAYGNVHALAPEDRPGGAEGRPS